MVSWVDWGGGDGKSGTAVNHQASMVVQRSGRPSWRRVTAKSKMNYSYKQENVFHMNRNMKI